jgi:hypothetical protein
MGLQPHGLPGHNVLASQWKNKVAVIAAEFRFPTVAQTVGFGLGMSKMLYLSMEID